MWTIFHCRLPRKRERDNEREEESQPGFVVELRASSFNQVMQPRTQSFSHRLSRTQSFRRPAWSNREAKIAAFFYSPCDFYDKTSLFIPLRQKPRNNNSSLSQNNPFLKKYCDFYPVTRHVRPCPVCIRTLENVKKNILNTLQPYQTRVDCASVSTRVQDGYIKHEEVSVPSRL